MSGTRFCLLIGSLSDSFLFLCLSSIALPFSSISDDILTLYAFTIISNLNPTA